MAADPHDAWKRLGAELTARRVELDLKYRNRRAFCADTGLDYRVVSDIETARRTNFSRVMLDAIERAYQLRRGSIRAILNGEEILASHPVPITRVSSQRTGYPDVVGDDRGYQALWDIPDELLPADEREFAILRIALLRARKAADAQDNRNGGNAMGGATGRPQ